MTQIDISLERLGLGGIRLSTYAGICISQESQFWQLSAERAMVKLRLARSHLPDLMDLQHLEWIKQHDGQLPDDEIPKAQDVARRIPMNVFAGAAHKRFAAVFLKGELPKRETKSQLRQPQYGFVYVIRGGPYYKIGCTTSPQDRFNQIQPKLPFETEVVCLIEANDMTGVEKVLHETFRKKRRNGEWFELDEGDVEYIRGLAQMARKAGR